MSFETGKFKGLKARHAMDQEHTLCGTAHDAGDSGDFEGAGSWVGDPTPKAVSCSDCQAIIRTARKTRLSPQTYAHDDGE